MHDPIYIMYRKNEVTYKLYIMFEPCKVNRIGSVTKLLEVYYFTVQWSDHGLIVAKSHAIKLINFNTVIHENVIKNHSKHI